jgi:transcriptional activator for dhaKLM operon
MSDLWAAREEFIDAKKIDESVPLSIAQSWQRSWGKINPYRPLNIACLNSDHLLAMQIANFDLMAIARPIMEDAYQYLEHTCTAILLVNTAGYVLDLLGDPEMLEKLNEIGIKAGALLSEEHAGTNAFGLAIVEQTPVCVCGPQHYHPVFHGLAGVAAPIFDMSGRSLGVWGLFTVRENYHPYALSLVATGARAVETQRQSDHLLAEQNSQLAQLNTILSSISDGIVVWNNEFKIVQLNDMASQLLGQSRQSLMGKLLKERITLPPSLLQAIYKEQPLRDVEVNITANKKTITCVASLYFVFGPQNNLEWGILTLKAEKDVRRLVQKQIGANALLTLDDIPGESPQIQRVRNFVRSAADASASILIRGEVGTGKNALANAIHNASQRRDGPFVIFPCSSIPNELIISELLGFDEFASPSGHGSRPSKFELAEGGTLFFQDVDALPLEAQAVLLNVLELGLVQRLGSQRPIKVDVRVIASTSVRMETLLAHGSFRKDLYYRLSTFSITIPPLRERRRDIPLVVDRVLRRLSSQLGYSISLGKGVMEALKRYSWPGNVREIEAVLGRAAAHVSASGIIELGHLPSALRYSRQLMQEEQQASALQTLQETEREAIIRAAKLCRGNISQMSMALGVSRTTLWRRLKAFEIDPRAYRE